MKEMKRSDFIKTCGRWSALAGLAAFGAVLLTREKKVSCNEHCGQCGQYENGKCGLGLK